MMDPVAMDDSLFGTLEDYVVCIPSKKRTVNMARMLGMFPYAKVYVDVRERDEYLKVVPEPQLCFHDSLPGQFPIWQHILDTETAKCVLLMDDDLQYVASMVETHPKIKKYTDPYNLRRIVENAVNTLCDLDMSLYGWSCMAHPGGFNPVKPISLSGTVTSAILIRGRKYRMDLWTECCDLDLVLQVLLHDRVLVKDMRWYWNFGVAGSQAGGGQTTDSMEVFNISRDRMVKKWGRYINIGGLPLTARMLGGKGAKVQHFGHTVSRKNSIVSMT